MCHSMILIRSGGGGIKSHSNHHEELVLLFLGYLICANGRFHHFTAGKNKCISSDAMYMPIKQEVVLDALCDCRVQ